VVFGIWDAEEFTLTGSTEWGEEHEDELARRAVACLNVDAAVSGDRLAVSAAPSLRRLVYEAARAVPDPAGRGSVYDVWRTAEGTNVRGYGVAAGERTDEPVARVLGSGSDYTVFFNHIGVPSLDMLFDGPYGVYHSLYDSHAWMRRFGDPGFRYHAAMARLWGLLALRLANAEVLPLDYAAYGRDVRKYAEDLAQRVDLTDVTAAGERLAAVSLPAPQGTAAGNVALNAGLMRAERALLDPAGIPGRPWFRHLVYAPLPSYEAETLPGIREAVQAGDAAGARRQATVLAAALRRAAEILGGAADGGPR
jgi:N-acetylated-alpha-linked acidic dipeptidase